MSGWLLLGLPGAMYAAGMNQIWIVVMVVSRLQQPEAAVVADYDRAVEADSSGVPAMTAG